MGLFVFDCCCPCGCFCAVAVAVVMEYVLVCRVLAAMTAMMLAPKPRHLQTSEAMKLDPQTSSSVLCYFILFIIIFFFLGGGGAVEGAERWCELSIDHRLVNVIKSVMVIMNLSSLIDYAIVVIFLSVVIKRNNMSF